MQTGKRANDGALKDWFVTFRPPAGMAVEAACKLLAQAVDAEKKRLFMEINGLSVDASPADTAEEVLEAYRTAYAKKYGSGAYD